MTKPLLKAEHISKKFSYPAKIDLIKDVSLELFPQQSIAIMGSSGVGKSTLLHILATLDIPSSGLLTIVGKSTEKCSLSNLRNQHIGFIFQSFNLLEDLTAIQNILIPAMIAKKETSKKSTSYARALELLERVGMTDRAHFPVKLLSGGEKQRIAIARALLNDPEILFADEPTGNLDDKNSLNVFELLSYCVEELGKGLIVVTHNPHLANRCHKTMHLQDGTLN